MAASVAFSAGVSVSRTVMSRKQRSRNTHRVTPVVRINGRTPYTAINIRTHTKTAAFFNNVSDKNSYTCGGSKREDYEDEDVDFYFEYMGMLASEKTYDRVHEIMKGRHPCDVLLLLAAQESDAPKVAELLESGADINVTDLDGKTALDICTDSEVRALLEAARS